MGWLFVKLLAKCEVVGVRGFGKCIVVDGGCVYSRLGKGLVGSWNIVTGTLCYRSNQIPTSNRCKASRNQRFPRFSSIHYIDSNQVATTDLSEVTT